jgi:hypothetical protein
MFCFPSALTITCSTNGITPRKADVVSKVAGDFRGWENRATYANAFPRFLNALNRLQ